MAKLAVLCYNYHKEFFVKKEKKKAQAKPWLEYYKEEGVPSTIEYPDCSMVDMVMQSAEKWPDNVAYVYYRQENRKSCSRSQELRR